MKVKIKKYPEWYGPYQLVERIFFWAREKDKYGIEIATAWVYNLGDKLAHSKLGDIICKAANAVYNHQLQRRVNVRIDKYDTWGMDETLGHIVLPMLKQLQNTKHGSPIVDLDDVPTRLHPLQEPCEDNGWVDDTHFQRWDYVLCEMIFAFETKVGKLQGWEDQFIHGECDYVWEDVEEEHPELGKLKELKPGPNHTRTYETEKIKEYQLRISNGFRLFGKYYESLWD